MMRLLYITGILLVTTLSWSKAQLALTDFNSTGRGGVATTFATDYQAIGINPANLGYRKSFRDPRFTIGFYETSINVTSDALDRTDMYNALFNSPKISFSYDEKVAAATGFANTDFSANMDVMSIGASVKLKNGIGLAFSVRDRIQFHGTFNQTFSEFMFLGGGASIFPYVTINTPEGGQAQRWNPLFFEKNPDLTPSENVSELLPSEFDRLISGGFPVGSDSTLLAQAPTYAEIFEGSRLSSSWYREYNISAGMQVFESYDLELFVGLGAKYIQGFWLQDLESVNGEFTVNNIAHSPAFGIDFGDGTSDDPVEQTTTINPKSGLSLAFPESAGNGYGIDVGFTAIIRDNLHLAFALNNYGEIYWTGDRVEVIPAPVDQFGGFGLNNYNVFSRQPGFGFATDDPETQAFPFQSKGEAQTIVELPSTYRFGASYEFFRTFHVGFDLIMPLNDVAGNITEPLFAVGGDFRPNRIFKISTGFNYGGNNGTRINFPAGITYQARRGFYELGIATSDLSSFVTNLGNGSNFSLAGGFLRFKFF